MRLRLRSGLTVVCFLFFGMSLRAGSGTTALAVDTTSREQVRQFYRSIYGLSNDTAITWTGSLSGTPAVSVTGTPGTTATAFKDAVALRVNWFRAMAGLAGDVTFDTTYNTKAQQAALMLAANYAPPANTTLRHDPPASYLLYTADGALASSESNLATGRYGPDAITYSYICDGQLNNSNVGHRRLIFIPQTKKMGTGDIPSTGSFYSSNALWVIDDDNYNNPRPTTRNNYVAWPAPGYVPYQVVFPRWSFAYPNADFSTAVVIMTRNGTAITVAKETPTIDVAENTLAWGVPNPSTGTINTDSVDSLPKPSSDTTYVVSITGVKINGVAQNFSYTVIVFDPDVASTGATLPTITQPIPVTNGAANNFSASIPSFSSGVQYRTLRSDTFTTVYGAEGGLGGVAPFTTGSYNPVVTSPVGTGSGAFHLATPTRETQSLRLPETFYLQTGATGTLTFLSRLAFATSAQVAHVQVSTDEGASWTDIYTQAGLSDDNKTSETSYSTRTVSLAAYAGRTFNLRFAYTPPNDNGVAAYIDTTSTPVAYGWFIDNIAVTGAQKVTAASPQSGVGSSFSFVPQFAGTTLMQSRGVLLGSYPMEWSAVTPVVVTNVDGSNSSSRISNLSVRTNMVAGQTLIVGAVTTGAKPLLVRGVGPTLANFIGGSMPDPRLELYSGDGIFLQGNTGWNNDPTLAATFASVAAFPFNQNSKDSALVRTINGGTSIQLKTNAGGIALVEMYDTGSAISPRLTNASTRNLVGTGDNILIIGFYVAGTGTKRLLLRAAGPKLAEFGVSGTLADPRIDLYLASDNSLIASNDNWTPDLKPIMQSVAPGFPFTDGSKDAAIVVNLASEQLYNIQVKGADGGTGEAIVELYELP